MPSTLLGRRGAVIGAFFRIAFGHADEVDGEDDDVVDPEGSSTEQSDSDEEPEPAHGGGLLGNDRDAHERGDALSLMLERLDAVDRQQDDIDERDSLDAPLRLAGRVSGHPRIPLEMRANSGRHVTAFMKARRRTSKRRRLR